MNVKYNKLSMGSALNTGVRIISLAVVLAATSTAARAETDSYAGASCQPSTQITGKFLQYIDAEAVNFSDLAKRTVRVTCPITRNEDGKRQRMSVSVRIFNDRNADTNFTCALISQDKFGRRLARSEFSESNSGLREKFLFASTSEPGGVYLLSCSIPNKGSSVISYQATSF